MAWAACAPFVQIRVEPGLEHSSSHMKEFVVAGVLANDKVCVGIVKPVFINMMDWMIEGQWVSERRFSDDSMLAKKSTVWSFDLSVFPRHERHLNINGQLG